MNIIYRHWAKAGGGISVLLITYVFIISKNKLPILEKYAILGLAFLMLHQFEEYVLPGGFKDYFNKNIYNPFGIFKYRLNDSSILFVNIVLGWIAPATIIFLFSENVIAVMTIMGVLFINGILHFFITFKTRYYNPGVLTGAILFIPLAMYSLNKISILNLIKGTDWLILVAAIIFASLLIPLSIYLFREKRH